MEGLSSNNLHGNFYKRFQPNNVVGNNNEVSFGNTNNDKPDNTQLSNVNNNLATYNINLPIGYQKLGVKTLSNGQEIHCYKLNNGQQVYIAPKETSTTVLNTYVNTGSMNEKDEERGISHFCEHMAFNGTFGTNGYEKLGKGDIFAKVAELGGYTNASTNYAETNYTISIPQFNKDDFESIVKIQSSMMNNLEMSDTMVQKEHGPVTSEINMYADMPNLEIINLAIKNLYGIKTTSEDVVAGTVENILNVDRTKVMDYYKNNYYPANMTTVVTGDVNPDEAIEIISKNFRGQNPQNPDRRYEKLSPIENTIRRDVISNNAVGTTGVLCFNGPENRNFKDTIAIEAINSLLFNRENSKTKKDLENYNVDVYASIDKISSNENEGKLLTVKYDSNEENSEIALKSILTRITNFNAPTEEEMETVKTYLKMQYENMYENMTDLNFKLGQSAISGGIEACTDAIEVINNLTSQDLVNAAHKYYDTNKVSIAVVHPSQSDINTISQNHSKAKSVSFTGTHANNNVNKKPLQTSNISHYSLPNNCEVATFDSKNDIASIVGTYTVTAPADVKPGVREILSFMLKSGNKTDSDLLDKYNIKNSTGITDKTIFFNAELPAKNINLALDIMKKYTVNKEFTEDDFIKAKTKLRAALETNEPNTIDNVIGDIYPTTLKGHTKQQILDNLDNVTLADVQGLHQYIINNSSFAVSASLPENKYPEIRNILNNKLNDFGQFQSNQPRQFNDYVPNAAVKVVTDETNKAQAEISEIFKFSSSQTPKEIATIRLMNSILSRGEETGLFNNLREKEKLAYQVFSEVEMNTDKTAFISCNIKTTTDSNDLKSYDNLQKSINGFNNQINKMMTGQFTDKELEIAKLELKAQLLKAGDTNINKVNALSDSLLSINGIECFNNIYDEIDNISRSDIVNIAQYIFTNKPIYSIRASKDTLVYNQNYLNSLKN